MERTNSSQDFLTDRQFGFDLWFDIIAAIPQSRKSITRWKLMTVLSSVDRRRVFVLFSALKHVF